MTGDRDQPTIGEAWAVLGARLGLVVEADGERSVRAVGTVRGRTVSVDIAGAVRNTGFLDQFRAPQRQRRAAQTWRTSLTVSCVNPAGLAGMVESAVDVTDPAWDPRNFDPAHCRVVRSDPPDLGARVVSPALHAKMMEIIGDARFTIDGTEIRLEDTRSTGKDASFVAGSLVHMRSGPIPEWPDRALVGPPWWIDLACDLADGVDAAR